MPASSDDEMRLRLLHQARTGYQRQEVRLDGIETRAGAYEGYATATAGLLAIGAAVLSGGKGLQFVGALDYAFAALLLAAAWCLVLSGFRGWQAAFKRIDWFRPYESHHIVERARERDASSADLGELAALLVAEHRGFLIEDWKLERLKQASRFFALALVAVLLAALLLVVSR